jgi:hypothetical protein
MSVRLAFTLFCVMVLLVSHAASSSARVRRNVEAILRVRLSVAFEALERGESAIAIDQCLAILKSLPHAAMERDALRMLAYAYATTCQWGALVALLESGGASALDGSELERYRLAASELGRAEVARRIAAHEPRDRVRLPG